MIGRLERPLDVKKPKRRHVGNGKLSCGGAGAQGVAPLVAPFRGVRLGANAKAVQYDEKHSPTHVTSSFSQ